MLLDSEIRNGAEIEGTTLEFTESRVYQTLDDLVEDNRENDPEIDSQSREPMNLSAEVNHSEEEDEATHEGDEANESFISKQGEMEEDDQVAEVESLPEVTQAVRRGSRLRQPPEKQSYENLGGNAVEVQESSKQRRKSRILTWFCKKLK